MVFRRFKKYIHPAHSLKLEVSLIFTLILGLILVIFSAALYLIFSFTLFRELDFELKLKAQEISQTIQSYMKIHGENEEKFKEALEKTIVQEAGSLRKWWIFGAERRWLKFRSQIDINKNYINFLTLEDDSLARSKSLQEQPELIAYFIKGARSAQKKVPVFFDVSFKEGKIRVVNYPFRDHTGRRYVLQVGISPQPIILLLENWFYYIAVSIPIVLVLTSFVGGLLAWRILNPVEGIIRTARQISNHDLTGRVKSRHYYREMNNLTEAFNDMIARLEKSFKHIELFSSHVAHELKTPLTIIKGEIEVSLMEQRREDEYRRAMKIVIEEVDRMLTTIDDLLILARLDYHPGSLRFEPYDFVNFIEAIYAQCKFLARKKKIQLSLQAPKGPVNLWGDQLHLRRLFFNLLDNAIKFTPPNGEVEIRVVTLPGQVQCSIRDSGEGIAPEDFEKIFERFYSNDKKGASTGLGLNMARSIARVHQGDISVTSEPGQGSTFAVTLPKGNKRAALDKPGSAAG